MNLITMINNPSHQYSITILFYSYFRYIIGILVLTTVMASCKTQALSRTEQRIEDLCRSEWKLTKIKNIPVDDTYTATIQFNPNGNLTGSLGCNRFFGSYFIRKERIRISYTGSTKQLCKFKPAEDEFAKTLKMEIRFYKIKDDQLIISTKEQEVLHFLRKK